MALTHRAIALAAGAVLGTTLLTGACGAASAQQAASGGTWGSAQQIRGLAALATGGHSSIGSVSCGSPGNCSAVGIYATTGNYHWQVFEVSQVRGRWGTAKPIPGTLALNTGRFATVGPVSCSLVGNCTTGGTYRNRAGHQSAFVVSQVRGKWRTAVTVPGLSLNKGQYATLGTLSCSSPGNCVAGGSYENKSQHGQAFVVVQRRGRWRKAIEVPGTAALNKAGAAAVSSVSCPSVGNCAIVGSYKVSAAPDVQVFVDSEVHGSWRTAVPMPGIAVLNTGDFAAASAVSCGSTGNCSAGGYYTDTASNPEAYTINMVHGRWRTAREVPGTAALGKDEGASVGTLSCASAGNCTAAGSYGINGYDDFCCGEAFAVSEINGTWGIAREVPGIQALNTGDDALVGGVSCPSPGNCALVGSYGVGSFNNKVYDDEAFVASQVNGTWRRAIQAPGTARLNAGKDAGVGSVSCAAPGRCSAGGAYTNRKYAGVALVLTEH